ncbi:Uridine 5'-monophosphate synthase [Lucilia cuprina]|uniref:Uridine 5'-monophosphate synthase n=1 Tax=Lucilia cuprina TaxID=7375 RepID=A0A0L0CLW6_LUCCU|nr:Uridine 5'-monophosphate synthase [Lucilia cuprina]KNC33256.1 Uridine 5'-monophosphate synthase [Lucilia cuprina]
MLDKITEQRKALALKLFEINAFKFGDFKMKVGINSPVYFDLRVIVSYPEVMQTVSNLIMERIKEENLSAKHVCGVPYTALPLATLVSVQQNIPMLVRRKEAKDYGTKKLIEGIYSAGDTCLIVEDVITSGSSVLDTVKDLTREGITVTDAVIVVDREQGGAANIAKYSVRVHSLFTLSFLLNTLLEAGKIDRDTVEAVAKYVSSVQIDGDGKFLNNKTEVVNDFVRTKISFESRANLAKCELAKQLFNLMVSKKTNLCLAADLTRCQDVLEAADKCGPYICVLKTHVDILEDFNEQFVHDLQALAKRHNFLLMEDRKFADIGNTVSLQYGKGLYKISNWADLVTAHTLSGRSILQGLKAALKEDSSKPRGVFLLGEMSATGNLIDDKYKEASAKIATEGADVDFVAGMVCQSTTCFAFPGLVQLTPGVKIDESGDQLGQQYNTPEHVIKEKGADVAVVGRGILEAKCMEKAAALYRDRLWAAYIDRLAK